MFDEAFLTWPVVCGALVGKTKSIGQLFRGLLPWFGIAQGLLTAVMSSQTLEIEPEALLIILSNSL